jgi:RecA-family ATPase
VVSAAELVATEVGEVPMLISPFLPAGGKAILAAHGGTGKTLLAINIALTVSNDLPLFQRWEIPSPGRVLYVDAESSRPLMTYRLRRVSKGLGVALAGVHLSFPMAKLDVGIRQIREEICREIEEKNARLVILDSFLCFGNLKNENDNTEVRDYLERIGEIPRMTGSSILLIDHAGKPSADKVRAGIRVQPRGASAKRDWADLVMILEERKHESKMLRTLSFDKTRFCATPPSMALEMNHNFTFIPSGEELTKMLKKVTGCSIRSAYRGLSRARELNEIEEQTDGRRKHNYLKHMEQQTMPWEEE